MFSAFASHILRFDLHSFHDVFSLHTMGPDWRWIVVLTTYCLLCVKLIKSHFSIFL